MKKNSRNCNDLINAKLSKKSNIENYKEGNRIIKLKEVCGGKKENKLIINNFKSNNKNKINTDIIKIRNYHGYTIIILMKIIKYFIIINRFFLLDFFVENKINNNLYASSITLKVNKIGNSYIFYKYDKCKNYPPIFDEIYINGVNQSEIRNNYDFNETNNNITLIWKRRVETGHCMFHSCSNISEINLSNFDSSLIKDMGSIFDSCSSLEKIDLTYLNTSLINDMWCMFKDCSSLKYIDLSNFNAPLVKMTYRMFKGCSSLQYLDLSSFYMPLVTNMSSMFDGCSELKYINFGNTNKNNDLNYIKMFDNTHDSLIICNKYFEWNNLLSTSEWIKINIGCNNHSSEYQCYKKFNKNIEYNKYICNNICGINYFQINDNTCINCIGLQNGYYLELLNNNNNYPQVKQCYSKCLNCDNNEDENYPFCIECYNNSKFELITSNYKFDDNHCFKKCEYYHYLDGITNEIHCTENFTCPYGYNKLIVDKNECIDDCSKDAIYKYEEDNICYSKNPDSTDEISDTINYFSETYKSNNDIIIDSTNKITKEITEEIYINNKSEYDMKKENLIKNFNKMYISEGNDIEEKLEENILINWSSTETEKNNINSNKTIIYLAECENIIKLEYNIPLNDSLYIFKLEKREEGMKIPKIEYEVYYPLYKSNELIQLNLSICQNTKIDLSIYVDINNENIDKYNKSSSYYKDICSKTDSNSKTDITLSDRKKEFIDKNLTLCEEDCDFVDYNYTSKKAKCQCLIKTNIPEIESIKFDKNKFFKSFIDINNLFNFKIIKCYKNIISSKDLINNYGFFIQIFILFLLLITLILFFLKYYFSFMNSVKNLILSNFNHELSENKSEIKQIKKKKKLKRRKLKKNNYKNKIQFNDNNDINKIKESNEAQSKIKFQENKNNINNLLTLNNDDKNKNNNQNFDKTKFNDNELNSLEYEKALLYDKRTYIQYYLSLLRTNHLFIFSFYSNNNDYNPQIIKIFLFFFFVDKISWLILYFLLTIQCIKFILIMVIMILCTKFLKLFILL